MSESAHKDLPTQLSLGLFIILTVWWLILSTSADTTESSRLLFGAIYGTSMSLLGGISGLFIAKQWGGWKSVMGKATTLLSLGLLAQFFGQLIFSYYNIVQGIDIPYPSLADLGYFGNIPLYIMGIVFLAKASGIKSGLKNLKTVLLSLLFPIILLAVSYYFFLSSYEFDWTNPLTIFLDFGYPLGQATYVSLALATYVLSAKFLGGMLRKNIVLFIAAFIVQYTADYNFLYQNLNGTWLNGGYGDYLYLVAYTFMTIGLLQLRLTANKIKGTH